jgi:D-alanine-D-alanine ligase-like ATP-grasp enzyme
MATPLPPSPGEGLKRVGPETDNATLPIWLKLMARLAHAHGGHVEVEPEHGYAGRLVAADGRAHFFKGTVFDINGAGATALARDKDYAARFLASAGLRVPRGLLVHAPRRRAALHLKNPYVAARLADTRSAETFAGVVGYPVFVKPNEGSEGDGVSRAGDPAALDAALHHLFALHDRVLVQGCEEGQDFRAIVLDGNVLAVFQRKPFCVSGDGWSPLSALVASAVSELGDKGKGTRILPDDPRILRHLEASGRAPDSIPEAGEEVALLPNANLSTGGRAVDVTGLATAAFSDAASRAARALGLRFAGVDLIASGPDDPAPVILEVNAGPGLSYFHRLGPDEAETVERIYARLVGTLLG